MIHVFLTLPTSNILKQIKVFEDVDFLFKKTWWSVFLFRSFHRSLQFQMPKKSPWHRYLYLHLYIWFWMVHVGNIYQQSHGSYGVNKGFPKEFPHSFARRCCCVFDGPWQPRSCGLLMHFDSLNPGDLTVVVFEVGQGERGWIDALYNIQI